MSRFRTPFTILLLILLPVGLYYQTVHFEFLDFDDFQYLTLNEHVRDGLTYETFTWAFRSLYASNWHPLTWLSHLLDIQLFGFKPGGHHLTNVFFHTINTLLLFTLLRRLTGSHWRSFTVAALFAVHPLHVESVAYVAERKDVLSTCFWLLTMLAYLAYGRKGGVWRYLLVVLLFALGLMAKPMLITLPAILLLMDYWPLERMQFRHEALDGEPPAVEIRQLLAEKLPLLLLSISSAVITFIAQDSGGSVGSITPTALVGNVMNAMVSTADYLLKTVWPAELAAYYPYEPDLPLWQVLLAAAVIVAISTLAVREWRRRPYLLVGWLWYLIALIPVIGIVQVGLQARADRYTYIPHMGIFIMVVWGVADLARSRRRSSELLAGLAGACIAVLAVVCWFQIGHWQNGVTLFRHTLAITENNWFAHHNLGVAHLNRGNYQEAIRQLDLSLQIRENSNAYYNKGNAYFGLGYGDLAIAAYREALRMDPTFTTACRRLAVSYQRWGFPGLAAEERARLQEMGGAP